MIRERKSRTKGKRYEARFNGVYLGTYSTKKHAKLVVQHAQNKAKEAKLGKYLEKAEKSLEGATNG